MLDCVPPAFDLFFLQTPNSADAWLVSNIQTTNRNSIPNLNWKQVQNLQSYVENWNKDGTKMEQSHPTKSVFLIHVTQFTWNDSDMQKEERAGRESGE